MNRIFLAATTALSLALAVAVPAHATQQGDNVIRQWKAMDQCTRKAQMAIPDYTPDANVKRDAQVQECLEGQNLPPREQLSPHP